MLFWLCNFSVPISLQKSLSWCAALRVSEIDIFSSTGNFDIITLVRMKKLWNISFVENTTHSDTKVGWGGSEGLEGIKKLTTSNPLVAV